MPGEDKNGPRRPGRQLGGGAMTSRKGLSARSGRGGGRGPAGAAGAGPRPAGRASVGRVGDP
jgi:hypothetical protein